MEDPLTGNLLNIRPHPPQDYSSTDSSDSTGSSSSEEEGQGQSNEWEAFFTNPNIATAASDEVNLLEFSIEEQQHSSEGGNHNNEKGDHSNEASNDPFANWEWSQDTVTKPAPVAASNDPFGGIDLMSDTPLLPTATVTMTTPSSSTHTSYPMGWPNTTSTSTTIPHTTVPTNPNVPHTTAKDPFGDIWGQASGKATPTVTSTGTSGGKGVPKPTMTNRPTYQMYGGVASSKSGSGLSAPSRDSQGRSPSPSHKFGK